MHNHYTPYIYIVLLWLEYKFRFYIASIDRARNDIQSQKVFFTISFWNIYMPRRYICSFLILLVYTPRSSWRSRLVHPLHPISIAINSIDAAITKRPPFELTRRALLYDSIDSRLAVFFFLWCDMLLNALRLMRQHIFGGANVDDDMIINNWLFFWYQVISI